MKIDVKTIRELAESIEKYNLEEVTVESEGAKVTLKREIAVPVEMNYVNSPAPVSMPISKANIPNPKEISAEEKYEAIVSPMVGTFYKSPAPGVDSFIKEGQEVTAGDTLCIVEAMKLMNEVKSNRSGKIVKIVAADGQQVKKGDKLFLID